MDQERVNQLWLNSKAAYEAEMTANWDNAYKLHAEAMAGWQKLVDDASWFNTEQREHRRRAAIKVDLHQERLNLILPRKNGAAVSGPFQLLATASNIAPCLVLKATSATPDMTDESVLKSLSAQISALEVFKPRVIMDKLPSYTSSIDLTSAVDTFSIERSTKWKQLFVKWFILTIKDQQGNTLYIAEACWVNNRQMSELRLYRAADYFVPCVVVAIGSVRPRKDKYEQPIGSKGRPLGLTPSGFSAQIVEQPDRLERHYWEDRRFAYGGRQFVWRPENRQMQQQAECLYEFTKSWPRPGSKTGKKDDDSLPQKLCWGPPPSGIFRPFPFVVHIPRAVDQVFKEYMLASQCARLACYNQA